MRNFHLAANDIEIDSDISIDNAEVCRFVESVFAAWHAVPTSEDTQNVALKASVHALTDGRSEASVVQIQFDDKNLPAATPIARLVVRIHSRDDSEFLKEQRLVRKFKEEAPRLIAFEILEVDTPPPSFATAIIYRHAQDREFGSLRYFHDCVLAALTIPADLTALLRTIRESVVTLEGFWHSIDPLVDPFPAATFLERLRTRAVPDLIADVPFASLQLRNTILRVGQETCNASESSIADARTIAVSDLASSPHHSIHDGRILFYRLLIDVHFRRPSTGNGTLYIHCCDSTAAIGLHVSDAPADWIERILDKHNKPYHLELCITRNAVQDTASWLSSQMPQNVPLISVDNVRSLIGSRDFVTAKLAHGDFHCKNVLANPTVMKVIDLANIGMRAEFSDIARLSTSLLTYLPDNIVPTEDLARTIEHSWNLTADQTESTTLNVGTVLREMLMAAVTNRHNTSRHWDVTFAFAVEAATYLRYVVEGLAHPTPILCEHIRYWGAQIAKYALIQDLPPLNGAHAPTLFGLWQQVLGQANTPDELRRAIATRLGDRINAPLTALQTEFWQAVTPDAGSSAKPPLHLGNSLLDSTRHILLSGPTSSGKSTLAEMLLVRHLISHNRQRRCALYIAPTRALVYSRYLEIMSLLRHTSLDKGVILSTGEDVQDDHRLSQGNFTVAFIINEKANSVLSRSPRLLNRMGLLVVDELHMLADLERGPLLEAMIAKLREEHFRALTQSSRDGSGAPRIVAISTEAIDDSSLRAFLEAESGRVKRLSPFVIRHALRPITVTHRIVSYRRDTMPPETRKFEVQELVQFSGNTQRHFDERSLARLRKRFQRAGRSAVDVDESRGRATSMCREFLIQLLSASPLGRTVLVFVPTKMGCEVLADWLSENLDVRENTLITPAINDQWSNVVKRFSDAINNLESEDDRREYSKWARVHLFVHNADVDRAVRHAIEELFEVVDDNLPTRILICTETLSYGVNLAVTDVVFQSLDYPTSDRMTKTLLHVPLASVAFHNMAGRAGRLGKANSDANVYIMAPEGCDPYSDIIVPYYSRPDSLLSCLYSTDDKQEQLKIARRIQQHIIPVSADRHTDAFAKLRASDFSYPFARCVLDVLRHINFSARREPTSGNDESLPATVDDIVQFFIDHSLHMVSFRMNSDQEDYQEELDLFKCAVGRIVDDCASKALQLVESVDNGRGYRITARGEAMLDTGTEITIVVPLLEFVSKLETVIRCEGELLVPGIYLLAIVAQEQIFRQHIRSTPELSAGKDARWLEDRIRDNQAYVKDEFVTALRRIGLERPEALATEIEKLLGDWEPVRSLAGAYPSAGTDAVLRLFSAMICWISGDSRPDCHKKLLYAPNPRRESLPGKRVRKFSGFDDFVTKLQYRTRFLASMLGSTGGDSEAQASVERELIRFARRLEFGCEGDAIPLFWKRSSSLSRPQASGLLRDGMTPERILRDGRVDASAKLRDEQRKLLLGDLKRFAADEFEALRNELAPFWKSFDPDYSAIIEGFEKLVQSFRESVAAYGKTGLPRESQMLLEKAFIESMTWEFVLEDEPYSDSLAVEVLEDDTDDAIPQTTLKRNARGRRNLKCVPGEDGQMIVAIRAPDDLAFSSTEQAIIVPLAVRTASDLAAAWSHVESQVSKCQVFNGTIIVVPFPWRPTNALGAEQPLVPGSPSKMWRQVSICTPAALMTLVLLAVREYISGDTLLDIFRMRAGLASPVSVDALVKNCGVIGGRLPASLRQRLLCHFEVV